MPRATETTIPHDLDAEKSVLGAILIDNETFAQAAEILQPPDFYRRAHQVLFARSAALAARGTAIDPITLKDALGAELEKVGGIAYISSLTDGVPRRTNIAHYAKIVRTHSRTRRLQRAVAEVQHDFQDGDLDRATARLRDLVGRLDEADDPMSDETWTETHRQTIQDSLDGKYVLGRAYDDALRAALAEIARLHRQRDELQALVDHQATENTQQRVVIEALKRDLEIE